MRRPPVIRGRSRLRALTSPDPRYAFLPFLADLAYGWVWQRTGGSRPPPSRTPPRIGIGRCSCGSDHSLRPRLRYATTVAVAFDGLRLRRRLRLRSTVATTFAAAVA